MPNGLFVIIHGLIEVRDGKDLLDYGVNALQMQDIISRIEDVLGIIKQILHLILAKLWLGVIGSLEWWNNNGLISGVGRAHLYLPCGISLLASRCA